MQQNTTHVLIVDDEPTSVEVLCALLENYVTLHLATNAEQALDVLETQDISIVLMDVDLPGTSGFELTKQIKSTSKYKTFLLSSFQVTLTCHMRCKRLNQAQWIT